MTALFTPVELRGTTFRDRLSMRDPHFAWRAAQELGVNLNYYPPQHLLAR
jgi:hypothetical protein